MCSSCILERPGHFWSTESCELNADVVSGCKYNLQACACRGQLFAQFRVQALVVGLGFIGSARVSGLRV